MAESNSKLPAPLQKFVADLREKLIKTETQIRELRAREASTKEVKLEKFELCPLCGGPERNARCACIDRLQKNAGIPSSTGMGSMGGGGTAPMGLSELCKNCGKPHGMGKCSMDEVQPGKKLEKDAGGLSDVGQLSKDQMPSSSAAAISPPKPRPATPVAAANHELGGFKSLAHSPASMPAAGGPSLIPGAGRKPITSMGRGSASAAGLISSPKQQGWTPDGKNGVSAPPSTAPSVTLKAEKNPGSARSPYGTGGEGHATQANMPSNLKANMAVTKAEMSKPYAAKVGITDHRNKAKAAYGDGPHDQRPGMHQAHMGPLNNASPAPPPVRKDENAMAYPKAAPEKKVEGAKLPKAGKSTDAKKQGSGGEILKKDGMAEAAKPVVGVPGKQPVGQGGGDAFKAPGVGKAKLPGPGGSAAPPANTKPPAKPAPAGPSALRRAGSADVGRMIADKGAARAPLPSSDVDVSAFDKGPNRLAPNPTLPGDVGRQNQPQQQDALQQVRGDMNLQADKKAGGVGFLRGLMSMFQRSPGQSVQPTGRGMAPAPGVGVDQAVRQLGGNNGNITRPTDSTGGVATGPAAQQQGLQSSKRFHGALPLQRAEFKKAALSMTKADLADPELDKAINGVNHNRRMLSVSTGRKRKSR